MSITITRSSIWSIERECRDRISAYLEASREILSIIGEESVELSHPWEYISTNYIEVPLKYANRFNPQVELISQSNYNDDEDSVLVELTASTEKTRIKFPRFILGANRRYAYLGSAVFEFDQEMCCSCSNLNNETLTNMSKELSAFFLEQEEISIDKSQPAHICGCAESDWGKYFDLLTKNYEQSRLFI
jgi:hypothetical protein